MHRFKRERSWRGCGVADKDLVEGNEMNWQRARANETAKGKPVGLCQKGGGPHSFLTIQHLVPGVLDTYQVFIWNTY